MIRKALILAACLATPWAALAQSAAASGRVAAPAKLQPCSAKVQDRCVVQKGAMQVHQHATVRSPLERGRAAAASAAAHPKAAAAYGTSAAPAGGPATNPRERPAPGSRGG